jgi:putative transposase
MPRQLRIQYEGAVYHLMSRGDRREEIFWDDLDRTSFLQRLGAACQKTGWQVHAYCLMNNHFHLVVETWRANLVEGMKWLLGTYAMRFNRRHRGDIESKANRDRPNWAMGHDRRPDGR